MESILALIKRVFMEHFADNHYIKEHGKDFVHQHIMDGKDDPGQWSPQAAAVIHAEFFGFTGEDDTRLLEFADRLYDESGGSVWVEPVNNAVWAVYEH